VSTAYADGQGGFAFWAFPFWAFPFSWPAAHGDQAGALGLDWQKPKLPESPHHDV
jgi:hypothetical protein